jgi:hypothetical protein
MGRGRNRPDHLDPRTYWFADQKSGMSDTAATSAQYQPGVCNIGTEERRRRRRVGHLGTGAGLLVLVLVAATNLPAYYALASSVFFIAGASGYLQDRFRFCAYYGREGEYNLGGLETGPSQVTDTDAREKDRKRARQIMAYSLFAGLGAGIVGTLLVYII